MALTSFSPFPLCIFRRSLFLSISSLGNSFPLFLLFRPHFILPLLHTRESPCSFRLSFIHSSVFIFLFYPNQIIHLLLLLPSTYIVLCFLSLYLLLLILYSSILAISCFLSILPLVILLSCSPPCKSSIFSLLSSPCLFLPFPFNFFLYSIFDYFFFFLSGRFLPYPFFCLVQSSSSPSDIFLCFPLPSTQTELTSHYT